jgi:hypothetical protein
MPTYTPFPAWPAPEGGEGGGVTSHGALTGRSSADQHPTSAITGLDAALAVGEQTVLTVTSAIAMDLTGIIELGVDPVPTPVGWFTAIFGQADPSLNGIWEGQTVDPGGDPGDYLPFVKRSNLPTENGVIFAEVFGYDADTLFAPVTGGWIIAQATDTSDNGGMGSFGALPGDGWAVVYGSQYWLDAIAAAAAAEVVEVYTIATIDQVEAGFGAVVTSTEITFAEAPPGVFRMLVDTGGGVWVSYTTDGTTVAPADTEQIIGSAAKFVFVAADIFATEGVPGATPDWSVYGIDTSESSESPDVLRPVAGLAAAIPMEEIFGNVAEELLAVRSSWRSTAKTDDATISYDSYHGGGVYTMEAATDKTLTLDETTGGWFDGQVLRFHNIGTGTLTVEPDAAATFTAGAKSRWRRSASCPAGGRRRGGPRTTTASGSSPGTTRRGCGTACPTTCPPTVPDGSSARTTPPGRASRSLTATSGRTPHHEQPRRYGDHEHVVRRLLPSLGAGRPRHARRCRPGADRRHRPDRLGDRDPTGDEHRRRLLDLAVR